MPPELKPDRELFCADELLYALAPEVCIAELITLLAASIAINRPVPWSSGSPVNVGFIPIFESRLSALRAVFASPTISTVHGSTISPVGIAPIADNISFKKSTFEISRSIIDAYVRIKPEQISFVDLLPPIAKAKGLNKVKTAATA